MTTRGDLRVLAEVTTRRVLRHLDGWRASSVDHGVHIKDADGRHLHLHMDPIRTGRVVIAGVLPDVRGRAGLVGPISVDALRGPDVIADEIRARLLPEYEAEFVRLVPASTP